MTALSHFQKHAYADWTIVSFADTAELSRGGRKLPRADYPSGFETYLPEITPGDESYALAKFPGKTVDFEDAIKIYLGPAWNSGFAADIQDRTFTGDDRKICDDRSTISTIDGWNLTKVCVEKVEKDKRVANLYFEKQTGDDSVVASWTWRVT